MISGFYKLPPRVRWRARIFGVGVAASAATATVGYFGFAFFSFGSLISEHGGSIWPLAKMLLPILLVFSAGAAYC